MKINVIIFTIPFVNKPERLVKRDYFLRPFNA